ncbi:DUF883 family protein [bacterium]|nr:DUF883 family protein [bacterium]
MVTSEQINGRWTELKGSLQERWGELTDDDLSQFQGRMNQLVGFIAQKTGTAKQEVEAYIDEFVDHGVSSMYSASEAVQDYAGRAQEQIQQYAEATEQAFRQGYDEASRRLQQNYQQASECVRRNPLESLAISFGAGIVTGVVVTLLSRRN